MLKEAHGKAGSGGEMEGVWLCTERVGGLSVLAFMLIKRVPTLQYLTENFFSKVADEGKRGKDNRKRGMNERRKCGNEKQRRFFWRRVGLAPVRGAPLLFRCTLPRFETGWLGRLFGVLRGLFPYQRALPLRNRDCRAGLLSALSVYLNESSFCAS